MLLTSAGQGISPFALAAHLREDEQLIGATNGANTTYLLPNGDKAINQEPGAKIKVYYNGQRLHEGGTIVLVTNDFIVVESTPGSGYDTVIMAISPLPGDLVTADYIKL